MAPIRPNPTLSEDLISEILVRVPVKSLLCFRSVSKTWLSLIKHPAFVKSQLRHATTTQTDQTLIISRFQRYKPAEEEMKFSLLHVDSREVVADRKFPHSPNLHLPTIIGSANGIVCVSVIGYVQCQTARINYLWNPAIRQSKFVTPGSVGHSGEYLGFGYDSIDHDYKIFRIFYMNLKSADEVYSVNKNIWRKLPSPTDIPRTGAFNVCVNGFLCAIGTHGMMTFDLNKEVLNCEIKLPVISRAHIARCIEFNNSVAVVIQWKGLDDDETDDWRLDEKICIWTLNDDACLSGGGVEALWTPMFRIGACLSGVGAEALWTQMFRIGIIIPDYIIFSYFNNRDLLLFVDICGRHKWILCNADKKEAKIVPLSVEMAAYHYSRDVVYKYTESLVSLPGFKQGEIDR